MADHGSNATQELTSHFFRNEYGKLVAVISRYLGSDDVETAEDIAQEALLKATEHWEMRGVPENPKAWLYTTAKNITLNILKRKKTRQNYISNNSVRDQIEDSHLFSDELIADSQLKMIFSCCHPTIPENSQIALVLKILSGFSVAEIADAFFSNVETINKRLLRGRKQLREVGIELTQKEAIPKRLNAVLKTIYLLFNEGYFPSNKNQIIRFDLCLEAIRLTKILSQSELIQGKTECNALLALMYFNASRFRARISGDGEVIDLREQDRSQWDAQLIQEGIRYLNSIAEGKVVTKFGILATISANHCVAKHYEDTNWGQILLLYDQLLRLEPSSLVHLNRIVVLSEIEGITPALNELTRLGNQSDISNYYLFHFTQAELLKRDAQWKNAELAYKKALALAKNDRDKELLEKKIEKLVLI